jgi:NitT/TauT family transport system substrate-binding protein
MRKTTYAALAIAGVSALAACGGSNGISKTAAPEVTVADCKDQKITQTQTAVTLLYLPAVLAQQAGYFEDLGLDVQVAELGASTESLQAVAAGSADIAVVSLSQALAARSAGAPVQAVSMVATPMAVQIGIKKAVAEELGVSSDSSPEDKARAFKGRTIGISSPGASTDRVARYLMESVGLTPDKDAKIVPLGGSSEAVAAFVRGSVDILVYSSPVVEKAAIEGKGMSFINMAANEIPALKNFDSTVAVANTKDVSANPAKYACYAAGLQRAMTDIAADFQAAGDEVFPSFKGLDKDLYDVGLANTAPSYVNDIKISPDHVNKSADFVESFGGKVSSDARTGIVATNIIEKARVIADEEAE